MKGKVAVLAVCMATSCTRSAPPAEHPIRVQSLGAAEAGAPTECPRSGKADGSPVRVSAEEIRFMSELRDLANTAPATALALADEGNRRFPRSPFAEERAVIAIYALLDMGSLGAARARAQDYFICFPGGDHSADVTLRTGVKPPPKPP